MANQLNSLPERRSRRPWYTADIILFGGFVVAYAALVGVLSLIRYVYGLSNDKSGFVDLLVFFGLGPVLLVWLIVLSLRMVVDWRQHIRDRRRRLVVRLLVSIGLLTWIALPFLGLWPPGYYLFTLGFRRYVKANADIESIRKWLDTVPPEECTGYEVEVRSQGWPKNVGWLDSIKTLQPGYVGLACDGSGLRQVRLTWGGVLGHWGFVVGSRHMEIPPTQPAGWTEHRFGNQTQRLYDYGEYRLPLSAGAYVWHELQ